MPADDPGQPERPLPKFRMPACVNHLIRGHRWRCRACRREVESQFREVCELWWASQREADRG